MKLEESDRAVYRTKARAAIAAYTKAVGEEAVGWCWKHKGADYWIGATLGDRYKSNDVDFDVEPLFAAPPAPAVPAGYKLVPVEPTGGMIDVFQSYCFPYDDAKIAFSELLAAAPEPEAGE